MSPFEVDSMRGREVVRAEFVKSYPDRSCRSEKQRQEAVSSVEESRQGVLVESCAPNKVVVQSDRPILQKRPQNVALPSSHSSTSEQRNGLPRPVPSMVERSVV